MNVGTCDQTPTNEGNICTGGTDLCSVNSCQSGSCDPMFCSTGPDCDPYPGFDCIGNVCTLVCDDVDTCTDDACNMGTGVCEFVDNGTCVCMAGDVQQTYPDAMYPGTVGVGKCDYGEETCQGDQTWLETTPPIIPGGEYDLVNFVIISSEIATFCDAVDDNCDGFIPWLDDCFSVDPSTVTFGGPSICTKGTATCSAAGVPSVCMGEVPPTTEICGNGLDDDCDGMVDEPAGAEVCDGIDNDCNGLVDDGGASASCGGGNHCTFGVCFQTCATTANCAGVEECITNDDRCQDPADTCAGLMCQAGAACVGGACFTSCGTHAVCDPGNELCYQSGVCRAEPDPCANTQCSDQQVCYGGACFDPCTDSTQCTMPDVCLDGRCAQDACTDVDCPINEVCYGGTCFSTCTNDSNCDPNSYCYDGRCAQDNCEGVTCATEEACFGGNCFNSCDDSGDCGGQSCWDTTNPEDICEAGGTDLCGDVQCGTDQTCFGGTCFDECNNKSDCSSPSTMKCFQNRCVDKHDPTCDGVICPQDDVCVTGNCVGPCDDDSDCGGGDYCFQGGCVDPGCGGVDCPDGESCYLGVCFQSCDPANPCVAPDGCFDGRCAPTACEALADTYTNDYIAAHPFTDSGKRLVGSQRSTPWFYAHPATNSPWFDRPTMNAVTDWEGWVNQSGSQSNAPVHKAKTARVVMFLDSTEGSSPGEYVLYLTHGASSGQGEATAVYSVVTMGVNPEVLAVDDPDAEGFKVTDSSPRQISSFIKTGPNETGGVLIGHFPADDDWSIEISGTFHGDIDTWEFYDGVNDTVVPLQPGERLTIDSTDFQSGEQMWPSHGSPCLADAEGVCVSGRTWAASPPPCSASRPSTQATRKSAMVVITPVMA